VGECIECLSKMKEIEELKKYKAFLCDWDISKVRDELSEIHNISTTIKPVSFKGHLIDALLCIRVQRRNDKDKYEQAVKDISWMINDYESDLWTHSEEKDEIRKRHGLDKKEV